MPEQWSDQTRRARRHQYQKPVATGAVSPEEVAALIGKARGGDYKCSPHHFDRKMSVHTVKVRDADVDWYIKWYFVEPNTMFISVHD